MRIDIVAEPNMAHQVVHAELLAAGLSKHWIATQIVASAADARTEVVGCWGWRIGKQLRKAGRQALVMERGHIGDRNAWTSLGWNGLNGRAILPPAGDGGRFEQYHAGALREWNPEGKYLLLVGQVDGDASLDDCADVHAWYVVMARQMRSRYGMPVLFRPHPLSIERDEVQEIPWTKRMDGPLDQALAGAALVVTWNSNTAVDAVLAGKPTFVSSEGSVAWPVAYKTFPMLPADELSDRRAWAESVAWRQWTTEELADGTAWSHVRNCMPMADAA